MPTIICPLPLQISIQIEVSKEGIQGWQLNPQSVEEVNAFLRIVDQRLTHEVMERQDSKGDIPTPFSIELADLFDQIIKGQMPTEKDSIN